MANLRIAELDFDTIKQNLKNFLSNSQSEFTDYDFEGSALSTLLDILAYNTHYNAYLANMTINEVFLDSAVKRPSAVSIAKHLGYIARSVRGARANITIQVYPSGSPSSLTLQRYTPFTTNVNEATLTFLNLETHVTTPVNGNYIFNNIEIIEGQYYEYVYTVNTPGPAEKYEIPNLNVDTSTLRVIVQNSNNDTTQTVYTYYDNISTIKFDSLVYFLEESPTGRFQVFFGDGIFGKKLIPGNKIILQYLISNGIEGNVSRKLDQKFNLSGTIEGNTQTIITVNNKSNGGDAKETINSIKFNAPRSYLAQSRAITADDYRTLILSNYPEVQSVSVWGGEDNVPPIYGKVIVSLKPYPDFIISNSTKDNIKNTLLTSKRSMGILTEFVDPEFIHIGLDINVTYQPINTTLSSSNITNLVTTAVNSFFNETLNRFDADFYLSKFISKIDSISDAIIGTLVKIKLQKRLEPTLYTTNSYIGIDTINFYNRIKPTGISSTSFNIINNTIPTSVTLYDIPDNMPPSENGTGTLVFIDAISGAILVRNVGTVDYRTGEITISSITPIGYSSDQTDIRITAELQEDSYNISATRQQVIVLDDSTMNLLVNRKPGLSISTITI